VRSQEAATYSPYILCAFALNDEGVFTEQPNGRLQGGENRGTTAESAPTGNFIQSTQWGCRYPEENRMGGVGFAVLLLTSYLKG